MIYKLTLKRRKLSDSQTLTYVDHSDSTHTFLIPCERDLHLISPSYPKPAGEGFFLQL